MPGLLDNLLHGYVMCFCLFEPHVDFRFTLYLVDSPMHACTSFETMNATHIYVNRCR